MVGVGGERVDLGVEVVGLGAARGDGRIEVRPEGGCGGIGAGQP